MGLNCISCGKNIGMLTVRIPLLGDESLSICIDCFNKMPVILNELYKKKIYPTRIELERIKDEVMKELHEAGYNQETVSVVSKFLDDKITKAREAENSEDGVIIKSCPICNKKANYVTDVCPDCGYIFEKRLEIEHGIVAKMYNERLQQYTKNPFYEYDYVVVPNNSDGTTDKEQINNMLISHATQGWRLVTMYSNVVGKNEIKIAGVGTNVTVCEDIMVFERCIKRGE